jgi:hypothetical protein
MILHRASVRGWFHSLCHRDLWLSPSSFWFIFYFLCTCQYRSPSTNLLGALMLISYYRQWVLIVLQLVQAIVILQWATTLTHSSSSLPHIPPNAPPSLSMNHKTITSVKHVCILMKISVNGKSTLIVKCTNGWFRTFLMRLVLIQKMTLER